VQLPGREGVRGVAEGVDDDGRLVVVSPAGALALAAGEGGAPARARGGGMTRRASRLHHRRMGLAEKLLADGERPLVVLRPHVRRLVRPALVLLVLAPAAAFSGGAVPPGAARGPVRLVVTALAALVAVRWVVWPFLLWWNTVYVLTDERFFERGGLVRRTGHDLRCRGLRRGRRAALR
jgi:hypothetical protein